MRPVEKRLSGIYSPAVCSGASGVREHRNTLSQRVSTALRCLGLKITFMFKLTRQNTLLRKQGWPDR